MTREELEKIYNEPNTTLTREKLNEIYTPVQLKIAETKSTLSSQNLIEKLKNTRVNQYKTDKNVFNVVNKMISQQNADRMMGIETETVGAEKYNSAPTNVIEPKVLVNSNVDELDKWLDTSYKMSKDEKKKAKDISETYMKELRKKRGVLSEEDKQEYAKMSKLYTKSHTGSAIMAGIADAMPFYDTAMDAAYKTLGYGNDFSEQWDSTIENTKKQNPIAYTGANIGMNLAKYGAGTQLLTGAGLLGEGGKITQGISKVIKNPKVASSVANILGDTSVDVALDTIPHLAENISKGEKGAGTNALKNIGGNLAMNTLGEGVGVAVKKAIPYLKRIGSGRAKTLVNTIPSLGAKDLETESKMIAEQLDAYRKGELPTSERIDMGILPQYMQNFGDASNPTYMNQSTVRKITAEAGSRKHAHGLTDDDIAKATYDLNSPIAVMKSKTYPNSAFVVSGRIDKDGNPIVIPVHMDKTTDIGDYNEIPSMYGKDKIAEAILRAEENGDMLFKNKERVDEILSGRGIQSPKRDASNDSFFNNSIPNSIENVNEVTDFRKINIPNHDEMNKLIDKYVGMYGDDAAKSKAIEFKNSINRVIAENSDEA